jgi:oxygen-independent coproporphyrinogen-3 oxidase
MKLILEGNINKTYVQTLCMMFFHGEKFPLNDNDEQNFINVKQTQDEDKLSVFCTLCYDQKIAQGSAIVYRSSTESFERSSKTAGGKAIYQAGNKITGKEIPWGILTGIRPSKVANEYLKNLNRGEAKRILLDKYLLSSSKVDLCLEVAENEYSIVNQYSNRTCSIYISIPYLSRQKESATPKISYLSRQKRTCDP